MDWVSKKAEQIRRNPWLQWRSHRYPKRVILKNGHTNIIRTKLATISRWRYLQDIFTTLMDAQWRWTVQFIVVEFFGCWLFFALIWWLIAFVHGDLQAEHLPLRQPMTGWTPCILNIHGFHSCFLYSLETQHTTGYGLRVITEECPEAIFILCFQCIIGMIIDSFTIGIVFAKMARAKFATYTVQFSKNAVMSQQDGKLCFMFRVGDIRRSRLAGVGIRAILIKTERTKEGEVLNNYETELSLKADGGDSSLFLLWPLTIYHEIDEKSPLYDFTVFPSKNQKIEIIVVLNATVESTGSSIESKSSYLASEILWGRRFQPVVSFNKHMDSFEIDWSKFDNTMLVNLPKNLEEQAANENESDSQETIMLLNDHDPGCSFSSRSQDVRIKSPQILINQHEMINFEEAEACLPSYRKPPPPIWQMSQGTDQNQELKSKYMFPETINESDESQEIKMTYV